MPPENHNFCSPAPHPAQGVINDLQREFDELNGDSNYHTVAGAIKRLKEATDLVAAAEGHLRRVQHRREELAHAIEILKAS